MNKTAIVMDSTGYLSQDLIKDLNITIVPLNVTVGNETFPETELSNDVMFDKLQKISGISTTSQPSVGLFLNTYQNLFDQGYEQIISMHLSKKISGTINSAEMAKDLLPDQYKDCIHIIDSGSSASGLGLIAWAGADMALADMPTPQILSNIIQLKEKTRLFFIVDTLEYLHRGGRIGGAAALFGTLLQIKPILYFNPAGEIDVFDKVRSRSRAIQRVLNELEQIKGDQQKYRISIQHVQAIDDALELESKIRDLYGEHEIRVFECGPVIATHVGPGALGIAFHPIAH